MRGPYRLVPDELSDDTVEALRVLYEDAQAGRLVGIAFAGMYRGRRYIVNAAGEARRSPTFSMGMVTMLLDELRALERPRP